MKRSHRLGWVCVGAIAAVAGLAAAQAPLPPGAKMPPGHLNVGGTPAPNALPPGHPSVGGAPAPSALPPGHPKLGGAPAPSALPPGHPSVAAPAPSALPTGQASPTAAPDTSLPPGHPSVDADDEPDEMPPGHPGAPGNPPQDRVAPAPDLRAGTVEVGVHDAVETPLAGTRVRLLVLHQDVGQGDTRDHRDATTDARGIAVFQGLPIGTAYSYRATVERGPATYATESFRLQETAGQRALLHVYAVTRDVSQALVGLRGVIFVQPREDVFHFEASFQVLNIGTTAWVPEGVRLMLPDGAKGFRPNDSMSDTRVDRGPSGAIELLGTFSPGQHDVAFQFQLDNRHERAKSFRIPLPPHVAELRVVAEGVRGMALEVEGFEDAEPMQGQDGSRLLVTGKRLSRGDPALASVAISLDHLPVPSAGRWYAVAIAVCFMGAGLLQLGRRRSDGEAGKARASEVKEAEGLILDELVGLERLRREDRIGPRSYEETKADLLDALARLDSRRRATPGS